MRSLFFVRACVAGLAGLVLAATFACCSSAGSPACVSAVATLCAKACSCGDGGPCDLVVLGMPDADVGQLDYNFSSSDDCTSRYQGVCGGSHIVADVDFDACQAGLASAVCAPLSTVFPSSGQGLVLPAACPAP